MDSVPDQCLLIFEIETKNNWKEHKFRDLNIPDKDE